ncbi:WD40 repeat domain-containing protein [Maridesulfovibrio hydrothermalis]|uniref:WD40 repeat domain-containing protein n=1 Tax=Maridesulfovibrio hydrothermalis AM13 = DSM 14728 TaxID=1121451 RepID=L0RAN9_9BACT|nr:WD40 repeat domain-containing protein [Maridesulfovibrio hydrothermalis]CCO23255.1 conserved exported protein of unknown function [Maridesulfovibrio hydrothermalis AM13 = DSM 14728]
MKLQYLVFILICFVFSAAGCGGGKGASPDIDEPYLTADEDLDISQLAGKRPATLAELVSFSASQQYSSLDSIYNSPPEGMAGNYYVLLSESKEVVNLAGKVTSYVQKGDILAAGFQNGVIKVYGGSGSGSGCGAVQAASEPVNSISWFPKSNYLAASSADNKVVEIFKVNECARVRVADVNSTVDLFAVSPKGSWLALVDEARRLWVGPVEGKLQQVSRFLHQPLSLSFSDEEGILMAVDVTGLLSMWSPLKLTKIYESKIKDGPFESVAADGPYLNIVTEKGKRFRWDIGQRVQTAFHESVDGFFLKDGVLSYHSPRKRLSRRVFFKPVSIEVERSPSGRVFKVNDIDGEFRYYSAVTGALLKGVQDFADWEPVKLGRNLDFSVRGHEFVLAQPIAQRGFQRLYCRFIPSKGYFLWWEKVARPDDYFKSRGMVPRRNGISAQAPLKWESFEAGKLDIRD